MIHAKTLAALMATTAFLAPAAAFAQAQPAPDGSAEPETVEEQEDAEAPIEISGPGANREDEEIVIRGRFIPNPIRATPEVVSVLSAEDIAKTGDGDIAGALERVTGLSVVGGRFVYVRGLGERYSSALLNGAPLPSPEPLRRVVPLDLFPTSIIASTVVQKSYSANYPGEFGGGVINLTTKSAPDEGFFQVGGGIGYDSETSLELGYTYFGSDTDWLGFDDGTRSLSGPLDAAFNSGERIIEGATFSLDAIKLITTSLDNAATNVIQRNDQIPLNFSGDIGLGQTFEVGAVDIGVIAVGGFSNSWRTRAGFREFGNSVGDPTAPDAELAAEQSFRYVSTQNRVILNGLASTTFTIDEQKIRLTGVYIRDVLKEAQVSVGNDLEAISPSLVRPDATLQTGSTSYFERELYDTQIVGEFRFGDFDLDLRGSYAKTRRDSPYERSYSYIFDDGIGDYVNDLRSPGNSANIDFSELDDELWFGAADFAYSMPTTTPITLSAGFAYADNTRSSIRRDFEFFPNSALNQAVAQQRIDFLLSDYNVQTYDIVLRETTGGLGSAAYDAELETTAGYAMIEIEPALDITINAGIRYEDAIQSVTPLVLFGQAAAPPSVLANDYWLPAGTITWNFADDMQLRASASQTIARPQFRELAPQPFQDFESGRTFFGNQFLQDSEILNVDARYEYYFARDQIFSLAAFYKNIDNPIEAIATNIGSSSLTSFANAPSAELYGAELEFRKYLPFYDLGATDGFLADRRIALVTNYTYTNSSISVGPDDTTVSFTSQPNEIAASDVFVDGVPLTGQSKHLANIQLSFEHEDRLSQQSILLTYSSDRVTARGPNRTPDWIEEPGFNLDVVLREAIELGGTLVEVKAEGRNLLGTDYEETQTLNDSILRIQTYERGRTFSLSATVNF